MYHSPIPEQKNYGPTILMVFGVLAGLLLAFLVYSTVDFEQAKANVNDSVFGTNNGDSVLPAPTRLPEEERIEQRYILQQLEELGSIQARAFLVGDLDTGEVIFERRPHEIFPIASITKFFTAYTALETLEENEVLQISQEELEVEGYRGGFKAGEEFLVKEMLYPLLLVSSNDAGEVLAQQRDRDSFIGTMKTFADDFQLYDTDFNDPTGLSPNNVSTARDLFKMLRIIKRDHPEIIEISRLGFKKIGSHTWNNINKAARIEEFRGGKTGYTNAARQTSVGIYEVKLANDQIKNIALIILQSNKRDSDTQNVLNYLKKFVAWL